MTPSVSIICPIRNEAQYIAQCLDSLLQQTYAPEEIEILTGKAMEPKTGRRKTILLGKCMYEKNKDNPNIQEMIAIKGCPPQPKAIAKALHQAGIMVDPAIFDNIDLAPGYFMKRYEGKPEFDMNLFRVL